MKILSIDTSSKICGVSVLDNENLICNLDTVTENSHSKFCSKKSKFRIKRY